MGKLHFSHTLQDVLLGKDMVISQRSKKIIIIILPVQKGGIHAGGLEDLES